MFESRIKSLQDALSNHEIDALLITSSYNIAYLSGIHAFSIEEREARILATKKSIYLFTDARYTEMVKQKAPFIQLVEVSSNNPFSKAFQKATEAENVKEIGFEEESITYKEAADLEEKFSDIEFIPTVEVVEELRTIKDNEESANIKRACALTDKAYAFILKALVPNVTETEVKAQLENFMRLEGGDLAFSSIVAFGSNSAIPHHLSNDTKLKDHDIVLLDFGAKVGGYCSDMTRTVFVGKPTEEAHKIYHATLEAQEVAIDYIKTHMTDGFELKKAHQLANSHLNKLEYPDIPHSLGHGVGLQVHEMPMVSPYSDEKLVPGMVITVEPGIYMAGIGGVRIEDTILITNTGVELLTKSPKGLTAL